MIRRLAVIGLFALLASPQAFAQDAEALYRDGREARRAGQPAQAADKLRQAARLSPDNADVQVELGLALTAAGRFAEAETALRHALRVAPSYLDARLGLARLAYFRKRFARARAEAKIVLAARPEDADAQVLLRQIDRAVAGEAARARAKARTAQETRGPAPAPARAPDPPALRLWRFDADGSLSKLTGGREDWRELAGRIGYLAAPGTTLSGGVEVARRNGVTDAYLEGRIDHKITADLSAYVATGGTPQAHFRPAFALAGGVAARVFRQPGLLAATVLTVEGKHSQYLTGPVRMVAPGIEQHLLDGKAWITAKWINTTDERGRRIQGYMMRGDLLLRDDLRVFTGYSDAPESSEGVTVATRTLFGGVSYDVGPDLTVRASFAYERRPDLFDRRTVSVGATHRF